MDKPHKNLEVKNNKIFFHIMLAGIAFLAYKLIAGYLSMVILALILAILFNPVYNFFYQKLWKRSALATLMTLVTMTLTFLVPFIFILSITFSQALTFVNDVQDYVRGREISYDTVSKEVFDRTRNVPYFSEYTQEEITTQLQESEARLRANSQQYLTSVSTYLGNIVLGASLFVADRLPKAIIFIFFLVGFLPTIDKLIGFLKKVSPLDDDIDDLYIRRVIAMSNAMVKGTLFIAIIAGLVQGLFFWIAGVDYVMFWTLIMIFLSIIPIGAGVVALPVGLALILFGHVWQGMLVILSFFILTSNIDNVLRPKLVPKEAELHPLLVLIGVLGGIQVFGFLGIVYGPVIMIFLMTTLEIYQRYYKPHPHTEHNVS